jgi:hypothetical protein
VQADPIEKWREAFMSDSATELRATLIRQRRFLILMSLALIAYCALGLKVKDEMTVIGVGLKITQPDRVVSVLWVVWGWSLWRYGQRVYESLSVLWSEVLDDVYAEDRRIALVRAKKVANRLAAEGQIDEELPRSARVDGAITIEPPDPDELRSIIGEKITRFRDYIPTRLGGRKYPRLKANFEWEHGIKWERTDAKFTMELMRRTSVWLRIRAWLHSLLRLPAFSEHIAPLLIAATAVIVWLDHLCVKWLGAISDAGNCSS